MSDLLLLTVDSLRLDRFDRETFSACRDAFESDFVAFENALANGVATPLSVPSIVTGRPAEGDGTLSTDYPTLAELYDGYAWAASNNPHLRSGRGYDRGFDFFTDSLEDLVDGDVPETNPITEMLRSAYRSVARPVSDDDGEPDLTPPPSSARHVLSTLRNGMRGREGFFWAHFIDPHYQFKPQKVLDREIDTEYSNAEILETNERYVDGDPERDDLEFLERFYDEQIQYLDRRLAAFFDDLRSAGRWDDATIVIASDHGEAFGERGVYNHQWDADPIDALVRVPLLVKFPGNRRGGETVEHLVQNADLLATLAAEFEWDVDRPPNTRLLTDDGPRIVVSKSNAAVRVTTADGVGIRRRDGSVDVDGALADDARSVLESASIPAVEKLAGTVPGLEDAKRREVKRRLEELGYR